MNFVLLNKYGLLGSVVYCQVHFIIASVLIAYLLNLCIFCKTWLNDAKQMSNNTPLSPPSRGDVIKSLGHLPSASLLRAAKITSLNDNAA